MKLGSTFTVPAAPATVFDLFLDADNMRNCIPGCEELVRVDDAHYTGRLVNEIAHVRFNATFSAEIVGLDAPREVRAVLKGEDRRLGSSLKLDAVLTVVPHGDTSEVTYAMEMAMWGKLGRMGESIVRRRTVEVERQFVALFSRAASGLPVDAPAADAASPAPEPGTVTALPGTAAATPATTAATPASPGGTTAASVVPPAQRAPSSVPAERLVERAPVSMPGSAAGVAAMLLIALGWLLGRGTAGALR